MEVRNKLEKSLLGLSSAFLAVIVILGFKLNDDNKKIEQILESLNTVPVGGNVDSAQNVISQTREQILSRAANSPAQDVTQDITTKTIVPGKIIKQTVPVASGSSATKSSSSSSTKKTKSS